MAGTFFENFSKDLELIYAKYSYSFDGDAELVLSACDLPDNVKIIENSPFSDCNEWKGLPGCADSSISDTSLPMNLTYSSEENCDLISYHKDEENGRIYTTPVQSSGEETTDSSSFDADDMDGWESDRSGPVITNRTARGSRKHSELSPLGKATSDNKNWCKDIATYEHHEDESLRRNTCDTDNAEQKHGAWRIRTKPWRSISHTRESKLERGSTRGALNSHTKSSACADLLTAINDFRNLFTSFVAIRYAENDLKDPLLKSKGFAKCHDSQFKGFLQASADLIGLANEKEEKVPESRRSKTFCSKHVVEKLYVRQKGSFTSGVELASFQSFDHGASGSANQRPSVVCDLSEATKKCNQPRLGTITPSSTRCLRNGVHSTENTPNKTTNIETQLTPLSYKEFTSVIGRHSTPQRSPILSPNNDSHKSFSPTSPPEDGVSTPGIKSPATRRRLVRRLPTPQRSPQPSPNRNEGKSRNCETHMIPGKQNEVPCSRSKKLGVKVSGVKSSSVKGSDCESYAVKSLCVKNRMSFQDFFHPQTDQTSSLQYNKCKLRHSRLYSPRECDGNISPGTLGTRSCSYSHSNDNKDQLFHTPSASTPCDKGSVPRRRSVPLEATPGCKTLHLSDISLGLCQTSTPDKGAHSRLDLKNAGKVSSQKRIPRQRPKAMNPLSNGTVTASESAASPIQSSPTSNRSTSVDILSGGSSEGKLQGGAGGKHWNLRSVSRRRLYTGTEDTASRPRQTNVNTRRASGVCSEISGNAGETSVPSEFKSARRTPVAPSRTGKVSSRTLVISGQTSASPGRASAVVDQASVRPGQAVFTAVQMDSCQTSETARDTSGKAGKSSTVSPGNIASVIQTQDPDLFYSRKIRIKTPRGSLPNQRQPNQVDDISSAVSGSEGSARKKSLKMKDTPRRHSVGFHPYDYGRIERESPSLSSPLVGLEALSIVSPSSSCHKAVEWSPLGRQSRRGRPRKRTPTARKNIDACAFERDRRPGNTCKGGACTKKFCFDCCMDCS